jgi:DNA polymerase IV
MPTSIPCILHLDADAFFASVEQRDEPRLRGKPVAVGTGVVASCSYESRRWGVRTAMRLAEAKRLCPRLIVLPGDYRRYEQAARRILAVCLEYTPRVEAVSLDDLYLDLTQSGGVDVERLAVELRTQIAQEVELSVSMGIAANKLVAAVATDHAKKLRMAADGSRAAESKTVRVPVGEESAYLAPWPVEVLPGVGPKTFKRLQRLNVRRVGELAAMPTAVLCGLFGTRGTALRDLAHGVDRRPVQPYRPQQSVSRCTSFEEPTSDRAFLMGMLDHLLDRAAAWLRFSGVAARGLKLSLRYGDYTSDESRVALRPPSNDEMRLKAAGRERLSRLYNRRLPLRYLGVELAPLVVPQHQPELFPDPLAERDQRLAECKDAVRRRFGFMALVSGTTLVVSQQVEHDRDNFHLRTPCLTK